MCVCGTPDEGTLWGEEGGCERQSGHSREGRRGRRTSVHIYKAVNEKMNDEKNKDLYEEKLKGIKEGKEDTFEEIYCWREEGLVCMRRKCVKCVDEDVKRNEELSEACHPGEEGGGHRKKGSSGKGSSGGQGGGQQIQEFAAVILGLLVSTPFGSFGWWGVVRLNW
jgi:hypothetical protein